MNNVTVTNFLSYHEPILGKGVTFVFPLDSFLVNTYKLQFSATRRPVLLGAFFESTTEDTLPTPLTLSSLEERMV